MRKTNIQNEYLKKLAFVNDQLCYFQFADEEVKKSIDSLGQVDPNAMTTDLFASNQYSARIRVRYEGLLGFREAAMNTSYGISTTFGVEHLICYIEDALELKELISNAQPLLRKFDSPEEKLEANVKHWGIMDLDPAVVKTIKYLRLRRNHIVHAREDLSEEFRRYIKVDGHHLNTYWKKQTHLASIDFGSSIVDQYSFSEAYECMKLIRVCIENVDEAIASSISDNDLIAYMFKALIEHDRQLSGKPKTLVRKVRRRIINDFAAPVKLADVESAIQRLLAAA